MEKYHHLDPAVAKLFHNRDRVSDWLGRDIRHTPPTSNAEHYPHKYKWDVLFATILKARTGYSEDAAVEILDLFDGQRPDGLVPSPQFIEKGRENDLERMFFTDSNVSDYGQPPIEALAAQEIYAGLVAEGQAEVAAKFLAEIFPKLAASYDYFNNYRTGEHYGPLIFNIHPHETGRDSDPTFDFFKHRLKRKGKNTSKLVNSTNRAMDYASVIMLGVKNWLDGWEVQKIRRRFEVYDVMFNCMHRDNLGVMASLAAEAAKISANYEDQQFYQTTAADYQSRALSVEQAIQAHMWFENEGRDGLFLSLRPQGPIKEVSVGNLFGLTLPSLTPKQLRSNLDLLDTNFIPPEVQMPIPSVPPINPFTGEPNLNYDPNHDEWDRLWRGSTWINMNWYLVERGLDPQAQRADIAGTTSLGGWCEDLIQFISERSYKVVEGVGLWEFYHPENTRPQRTKRSPNFAWSALAYLLKYEYLDNTST